MNRPTTVSLVSAAAGYAALQFLGRTAGSTWAERRAALPGDDLVQCPQIVTDHAVTIAAPPAEVWPWLTQMGWHLGGYYTPRWVDRTLFHENWASLDRLDPRLVRELRVGDTIPDGKPGTARYAVTRVEVPHLLLLRSTTHLPPGWEAKYGAHFTWTWCFHLTQHTVGLTRVHLRVRGRSSPWWFTALYAGALVPADLVMGTGMLRGLRTRVEARSEPQVSGRTPLTRSAA